MSDITDIKIKTLLMDIDYVSRLIDGLEDESVDVIKELVSHHEATKDSQWVSVKPNSIGYYWLKNGLCNAIIVDVFSHNGQFRFMVNGAFPGVGVEMTGSDALWAGPVPMPLPLPPQTNNNDD